MNWFDLLLLGIIIVYTISGFARGLVKQLFSLFGFIIAIALAFIGSRLLSGVVAGFIDPEKIISSQEVLLLLGLESTVERAVEFSAGILTFLALFIIFMIVFRFFSGGFKWVNKIPVVGAVNRLGGAVVGLVIGLAISYVALNVFTMLPLEFSVEAMQGSAVSFVISEYVPMFTEGFKDLLVRLFIDAVQNDG